MRARLWAALAAGVVALAAGTSSGDTVEFSYRVVDLGTAGGTYSYARSVNEGGMVVGHAKDSSGVSRAYYGVGGTGGVTAGELSSGSYAGQATYARGVNDAGVAVGYVTTGGNTYKALQFQDNVATELNLAGLGTVTSSLALAINASNWVVGEAALSNGSTHAYLYKPGANNATPTVIDLGVVQNSAGPSQAYAINNDGQVTGYYQAAGGQTHAFRYNGSTWEDLGNTLGAGSSYGRGIDPDGRVAGYYQASDGKFHGFMHGGASVTDVVFSTAYKDSFAYDVNTFGDIVGYARNSSQNANDFRAFVRYRDGVAYDLTSRLDALSSGWTILEARSVNEAGDIAAVGIREGSGRRALLLKHQASAAAGSAGMSFMSVAANIRSAEKVTSIDIDGNTLSLVGEPAAVPLPGVALAGMALLSGFGLTSRVRRRAA